MIATKAIPLSKELQHLVAHNYGLMNAAILGHILDHQEACKQRKSYTLHDPTVRWLNL